ncbi:MULTISPECIES: hypothetical protein [Klebsiella]|uniref:hypothetical protein n=1 Tax=Klebsiella pneumoniae complex TaxID=3390273 RepID=UPI00049F5BB1|nr:MULTISPECIES: hypothetical protein [Klebsiella]MCS5747119.1 hypothetical protein [Klebsiella pneumoniae subsp. pneumoniae]EKZ5571508.1 hypothetical protein [Klebsiella pneumoniae]KDL51918.1 hypothetical protein AD94_05106 [Klebsiella variicola]MBC4060192.1 hypothetical protein [Klebsiella pneumoniae]MBP3132703.1 hypothetical protein [Klebsiella pneumoniae]
MKFFDESYEHEVTSITSHITSTFPLSNDLSNNPFAADDSILSDVIISLSWRYFIDLYFKHRDLLNEHTPFNQAKIEGGNLPSLSELKSDKHFFLFKILRLIYEYNFWTVSDTRQPLFLDFSILERLDRLSPKDNIPISFTWIEQTMPAALVKHLLRSDKFSLFKNIATNVSGFEEEISKQIKNGISTAQNEAEQLKEKIETLVNNADSSIKSLQEYDEKLKQYKSEYNFVLLSKAFSNLLKTKKAEYVTNHRSVIIFSSWLIATPLFALLNHIYNFFPVEFNLNALFYYLPILSLELLFFYFMRLYYIEGKAIKAQLLQIEQRLSLCEFIHDYVETKNNSGAEKESWSLFEKLIFSPIQVSSENIPSLLDGASSIAELAGKVLSKDSK